MTDKNKELHSALFDLEEELNGLKSAKQQIEEVISIGSNVVKNFQSINNSYNNHLSNLKDDYQSKLDLLKNTVEEIKSKHSSNSEELKKLSCDFIKEQSELNAVQQDKLGEYSKRIKDLTYDFISKQTEVNELKQKELVSSTKLLIDELITSLDNSINSTTEVYQNQNQKINEQLDFYNSFVNKVEQLTVIIGNVDFPNRLDKLDNTVSAINIGIQNNQAKLDELNSSLRNELNKTVSSINQGFEQLELDLKIKNRNTMIAVVLGILISLGVLIKLFL